MWSLVSVLLQKALIWSYYRRRIDTRVLGTTSSTTWPVTGPGPGARGCVVLSFKTALEKAGRTRENTDEN